MQPEELAEELEESATALECQSVPQADQILAQFCRNVGADHLPGWEDVVERWPEHAEHLLGWLRRALGQVEAYRILGCVECGGHGYDVFGVDRAPFLELEAVDGCGCLADRTKADRERLGESFRGDDAAALLFARDLEKGDPWAKRCAVQLLTGDQSAAGLPEWQGLALEDDDAPKATGWAHDPKSPEQLRALVAAARAAFLELEEGTASVADGARLAAAFAPFDWVEV